MKSATIFQRIIQEQENNLFLKNYSEKMINSTHPSGQFIRELKTAFSDAIQSQLWIPATAPVSGVMMGRFGKEDRLHLQFSFEYDPLQLKLRLVQLTATLNDKIVQTYPVKQAHRDLPPAGKVYQDLARTRNQQLIKEAEPISPERQNSKKTNRRYPQKNH